jgi:hypothetical protein
VDTSAAALISDVLASARSRKELPMSRRNLLNVVLLGAVLLLGAIVFFAPGSKDHLPATLTALDRDEIQRIDVRQEAAEPISLERRGGHWYMTAPLAVPAADFAVRRLLSLLSEPVTAPLDSAATSDERKFGLANPKAIIDFDGTAIAFGDTNPMGNRRYVRTNEGLFLIPDAHLYLLERGIYGLIDTRLLPPGASIASLRINELTIERDKTGQWTLISPRTDTSIDQIVALVQHWEQASALRVAAAKGNSQVPAGSVAIELQGGQVLDFGIRAKQPELVLTRPALGIAYHLPASQAEQLLELVEPTSPETPRPQ